MSRSLRKSPVPAGSVLEALAAGEFLKGLQRYAALEAASAEEEAWAGQCLVLLGRRQEGIAQLLWARASGCEDAGALAAVAYRFGSETERASALLESLKLDELSGFGKAVLAREQGMLHYTRGDLRTALSLTQQAWEHAASHDVGRLFLPAFAAALSMILAALGRDEQALQYVEMALPQANPAQRAPLLWTRALSALHLGQLEQADQDLNDLGLLCATTDAQPLLHYHRGLLQQTRGLTMEAREHFEQAVHASRSTGQAETEFYAQLRLCSLATSQDDLEGARKHLARANALADGSRAQAFLTLRQAAVFVRQHDPRGVALLHVALDTFEQLDLAREAGLTFLNLAEACLRWGRVDDAYRYLCRVVDIRHALGNGASLATEIRSLPAVHDFLRQHAKRRPAGYLEVLWQDTCEHDRHLPTQLVLTTLGGYGLTFQGAPVKLNVGLQRTVELLAFLLNAGEASLEQVQTHVFEDNNPEAARDYLHVARNALGKAVPQLLVPYDKTRRVYQVKPKGVLLNWDVQATRAGLDAGGESGLRRALSTYSGPFLPCTDSSWAKDLRSDLEWSLVRLGLETLEVLQHKGEHQASVDLARRLLTVQPLDIGIHALLVRGVQAAQGAELARQESQRSQDLFQREFGDVPERLRNLHNDLQAM